MKGKSGIVKRSLGYAEKFLNEYDKNPASKANVAVRYKGIHVIWQQYNEAQNELEIHDFDLEARYQERQFHNKFYSVKARIQKLLNPEVKAEAPSLRSSSSGHKSPSVRLPTINLPIFDGRFTE